MKNRELNEALGDVFRVGLLLMLGLAIFKMFAMAILEIASDLAK